MLRVATSIRSARPISAASTVRKTQAAFRSTAQLPTLVPTRQVVDAASKERFLPIPEDPNQKVKYGLVSRNNLPVFKKYNKMRARLGRKDSTIMVQTYYHPALIHHGSWRIVGGVVIQRDWVIAPLRTPLEAEWEAFQYERQKKTHHQLPDELVYGDDPEQRAIDKQDEAEEEASFTAAERETPDDKSGNRRTTNRKLDQLVYLVVKKKRTDHAWQFPQVELKDDESIRQTAQRALYTAVGDSIKSHFIGHAPIGHLVYTHKCEDPMHVGTKAFFCHALYRSGDVKLSNDYEDFQWVTKAEMKELFHPTLWNLCETMILEEDI